MASRRMGHPALVVIPHVDPGVVLGAAPVPWGSQVIGTIAHPADGCWGALVRLSEGVYVHVAAGAVRSLPQDAAAAAALRFVN
jgi:hypothetical protein